MSEKKAKAKKEEVEEQPEEQVQPEVKKKKKKAEPEEITPEEPAVEEEKPKKKKKHAEEVEHAEPAAAEKAEPASEEAPKKKKKKTAAAETTVHEVEDVPPEDPKQHKLNTHVKTGTELRLEATSHHDVDAMQDLARMSHRTPRSGDSPRLDDSSEEPEQPTSARSTEGDNKKKAPAAGRNARLYVNVTEAKDIKPGNYFVTLTFSGQKEPVWTSDVTKKSTTWTQPGRYLPIPKGSTHFTLSLYSKGLVDVEILNKLKGEAAWEIKQINDGYPHQPWAPLLKKNDTKCSVRIQLMYFPEGVEPDGDEFVTPLHALIRKDKLDLFTRAVDDLFADLTLQDADHRTPLHLAVQLNRPKFVKLILKKLQGEGNGLTTNKKETALHFAARYSTADIAGQLLKAGLDVNAAADLKRTPLHVAAQENNVEVIKALGGAEGIALNAQDKEGNTPLAEALLNDRSEAVTALVELGSDVYVKNENDLAVWEIAQRKDLVNMEPRKAFMAALAVHDAREFPLRTKLSKKTVVKGEKCALDYEESTQFAISVEETTEVSVILTTDDLGANTGFVANSAFALVKSDQGSHNEPHIFRDTIAFSGNKAVTLKLEPNNFYVAVPYAKTEDGVRDYVLVVLYGKKKKVTVTPLKPWLHHDFIHSDWAGKTAGGAQPAPTWTDNPHFELTMPQQDDVRFLVHLSQEDNEADLRHVDGDDHKMVPFDSAVGFYVCDRQGVKVLAQADKWINSRDVHKEFVMNFSERNHICIIPTIHQPDEEGPFCLRIYCDQEFTMEEKGKKKE